MKWTLPPLAIVTLLLVAPLPALAQPGASTRTDLSPPGPYVVDLVATASFGVDMNDAGDVIGTSYRDVGCGSSCLPPLETVVWRRGRRIVLPTVPGLQGITVTGMNNAGWVVGFAGFSGTTTHAVAWKPAGHASGAVRPYEALDLGNLPGRTISTAAGIDELGRVVGWSTTANFPPSGAPFLWTEAGGMVNLTSLGFPDEWPLGISPDGTVATYGFWYRLGDPSSVMALPPAPSGFMVENSRVAVNDAGDQARFLIVPYPQILDYPFRFHHEGTWQQLSTVPTGHLSRYAVGGINEARDVTVTVASTGMIAYGPAGLAQPLASLVSPAYGGGAVTDGGPVNASGEILGAMMIGRSPRLVRLVPGTPCTADCIRVADIQMTGRGPAYCNQGQNDVTATLTVTDEAGLRLPGVRVTAHFLDDYWMDKTVVGQTNASGQVTFTHVGPPCVGAVALLVTGATSTAPERTLDRTTGVLTDYVIPLPGEPFHAPPVPFAESPEGGSPTDEVVRNVPNPFEGTTTIRFGLHEPAPVRLAVFDALGREVALLLDAAMAPGRHEVLFDASVLPGGVYFARLTAGAAPAQTLRMTLLK